MVKKNSPKSSNTNVDDIKKELKVIKDDFKSNKKKISKLEQENKELTTTLDSISTWKNKFDNIDNIRGVSTKDDLNNNLPFFLLDIMKNINALNDFNINLLNEVKKSKKRTHSDSDDSNFSDDSNSLRYYDEDEDDDEDVYDDDDVEDDMFKDVNGGNFSSEISQEELDDLNANKNSFLKQKTTTNKLTTNKLTTNAKSTQKPKEDLIIDVKMKNEISRFFKHHQLVNKVKALDNNNKSIVFDYLKIFYDNGKLSLFNKNDISYFIMLSLDEKVKLLNTEISLNNLIDNSIPPRYKIINSSLPIEIKNKCLQKLTKFENSDPASSEYNKLSDWINGILSIPWNTYKTLPVNLNTNPSSEIYNYLENCMKQLDNCVYGQNKTKQHMIQLVSKMITNPNSVGNVFSIYGPMGTGKTTIIKEGLSKLLGLPFIFISLGGASDSAYLDGHSYTYEGAIPGRIIESLKTTKCMNPVFYFDELDKVSDTSRGLEIINLLIHLTDPAQNNHFQDKYYGDIPFDLSKALFVFSFNNINKINPILKDRMNLIKVDGFNEEEKMVITKDYLLPSVMKEFSISKEEIIFSDDIIKYIINKNQSSLSSYNKEEGVRNIKRRLEIIISNLNVIKIAFITSTKKSTPIKQLRKRSKTEPKTPNKINNNIDIELIKKILPELKNKLKNKHSTYLEESIKNIKIPLTVSRELVDLFIDSDISDVPMQMYT